MFLNISAENVEVKLDHSRDYQNPVVISNEHCQFQYIPS